MTRTTLETWRNDFGIGGWVAPAFFGSKNEVESANVPPPQAHALRRAFDRLKLDGIVCFDNAPTVYFRELPQIDATIEREMLRLFWNQGLAPILVLITDTDARIYSSLIRPELDEAPSLPNASLVRALSRIADASEIRQFILSVQSGEFFRLHSRAFDPKQRVDRDLLRNLRETRQQLADATARPIDPLVLDALLCRLVFTCYLFDRGIIDKDYLAAIGVQDAPHLRDLLGRSSRANAKSELYTLFGQLGHDFNGDLFSDDLAAEAGVVTAKHLDIVNRFFRGTDVRSGQQSLWPYDFGVIPIETISAIYEHFLKAADENAKKTAGAFYTPRFLAEIILDIALEGISDLLHKRFLDPSCGSGIFLVALFNRLAEEWKRLHPQASYDAQVRGFTQILKTNLFGTDKNQTACRITAFSLYLAFLDQLSPPEIRRVLRKTKVLPRLISDQQGESATVRCADFFEVPENEQERFDLLVGNPPWKSETDSQAPLIRWCADENLPLPDHQIAIGFAWKAPRHLVATGRVCFVLPHGVLFNHGPTALDLQKQWLSAHQVELVLNLADFQRFLFEEAENPALVLRFLKNPPDKAATIRYWTPKTDWNVAHAELISIYPEDQTRIRVADVLSDLRAGRVPLVWKERFWGTPRDWKLLDRLRLFPSLADVAEHPDHQWIIAQGFLEPRPADGPEVAKEITLPTKRLAQTTRVHHGLFLTEDDCDQLKSAKIIVRRRLNTDIFLAPHVLVTDGFKVAYADFDVAFRQAVRGIHGPTKDRNLLAFLAAYLRSPLALYYLFHTSGNIGIERAKVEKAELLRIPFPLPMHTAAPGDANKIIRDVSTLMLSALNAVSTRNQLCDRASITADAQKQANDLVYRYFDIDPVEQVLIEDTNNILLGSARRRKITEKIPTLRTSSPKERDGYFQLLCETLNDWAEGSAYRIDGQVLVSSQSGLGVVVLDKQQKGHPKTPMTSSDGVVAVLERLERAYRKQLGTVSIVRGVKVFAKDTLYLVKPLSLRFWTRTAALNHADSIAASILSHTGRSKR